MNMNAFDKTLRLTALTAMMAVAGPSVLMAQTTPAAPSTAPAATTAPATPPATTAPVKKTKKTKAAATAAATPPPPAAAPAASGAPVFPSAVDTKYASQKAGDQRMHTCLDQYHANKAANGNGGLKWIQKGGGYYSECSKKLKG